MVETTNDAPGYGHSEVEETVGVYRRKLDKSGLLTDALVHAITERVHRALNLQDAELMHAATDLDSYAMHMERYDDFGYGEPVVKRFAAACRITDESKQYSVEEADRIAVRILRSMVAAGEVKLDVARLMGGGLMKNVFEYDELRIAEELCVQVMSACIGPDEDVR